MDKTIEILSEKVLISLSGWSFPDQAYMLGEIAEKLKDMAGECLEIEYGLTNLKLEQWQQYDF
jgi:hypothetical protein